MRRGGSLLVLAAALLGVAADCQQCQQVSAPGRGNLDRAADAVLVRGDDGHTYVVVPNPELGHLRVLDLTAARFVEAPNRFFPLSIPAGTETRRLATAPGDDTRIYALDAGGDEVFMVRAVEDGKPPWVVLGDEPVQTGRAPAAHAAFRIGGGPDEPDRGLVELWVTLPDEGAVQVLGIDAVTGAPQGEIARIDLPAGSHPGDIVVDPFGDAVVVGDAALPVLWVLRRETLALDRALDVGGPVSDLAVGVVDIGDGEAPVVLAARRDANVVTAVRLFRPGFREDRYAVLGSAELPSLPLVGYVPDQRESVTVCCRELSAEAVRGGEATDAWAAVATADGKVVYLALAAVEGEGRVVRLIDNDLEPLAPGPVEPADWIPAVGDEDRRPSASIALTGEYGDPPFVPLLDEDERLTMTWQGRLPTIDGVRGAVSDEVGVVRFTAVTNLEARGARVGDIATLVGESEPADCDRVHDAQIVAVAGTVVDVVRGPAGIDEEADLRCLIQGGQVRLRVNVSDAFVVFDADGDFLGRLGFDGEDAEIALPGAVLSLAPSSAGPPLQTGSVLRVPLDRRLGIVDLDLSDPIRRTGGGGFATAANVPVALVGAEMDIPGRELGSTIRARRMIIATAGDLGGINILFACDDAETIPTLCAEFR
jgi:hypothetical protein